MSQEHIIWRGTPSHVINIGTYTLCLLFCWLILPVFILVWKLYEVRATKYELTTQRLRLRTGVLRKVIDDLELYRVKDFRVEQPLIFRFFSVANIVLETSDKSHPTIVFCAIPDAEMLLSTIREHVEKMRHGRVREMDVA